jgi:NAD(P)-dependent dehydrogenase (short-subunit alcohol dehydrogenase family)
MDIAIVTGAETPLGLRTVQTLVQQGYHVHGIGNNFSKVTYADHHFKAYAIDLTDLDRVAATFAEIIEQAGRLDLLVHAIDVTPGNAFEKLPVGNLEAILKVGLLGPAMMTRLALPNLLRFRGQLVNIITTNKHGHPPSAANALVEGGLREMNRALFNQARDAGMRITNCLLRQNTELADATASDAVLRQTRIDLEDVVRTIEQLVDPKVINVPEEVVLHPRLSPSAEVPLPETPLPVDSYAGVVLPPREYAPPAEPKIPTEKKQPVERTIPYTDEEMEDKIAAAIEDFEAHPERYDQPGTPKAQSQPPQGGGQQGGNGQQGGDGQQGGPGKNKRRRRRRGGRNRNKQPQHNEGSNSKPDNVSNQPDQKAKPEPEQRSQAEHKPKPDNKVKQENTPKSDKPKRRPRVEPGRVPDASKGPAGDAAEKPPKKKVARKAAKPPAAANDPGQPGPMPETPVKSPKAVTRKNAAKKKTAKPAAGGAKKKAVKKSAAKKAPAKKAAKKKAAKTAGGAARKKAVKKVVAKE